ncbi:hypothetical protein M8C21_007826, partial [Ambrosia artemisiifolia]
IMSSTNPPSNFFPEHEKDDVYNNPLVSSDCFQAKENITTRKQDLGLEECDENENVCWSVVKTSNKDHHSKIQTAQGPRDRRVRFSIEVAKRFFYLQELLGFDKGSKTLDWLLKKSKNSIDELIKRKKESSSSSTLTDQSEVVFLETGSEKAKARKKKGDEEKTKKKTRKYKSGAIVNQSRVEARARARERTKEKLNVKKLDEESKNLHVDCCSSNLTLQSSFWNSQNDYGDKIGDSIMEMFMSIGLVTIQPFRSFGGPG